MSSKGRDQHFDEDHNCLNREWIHPVCWGVQVLSTKFNELYFTMPLSDWKRILLLVWIVNDLKRKINEYFENVRTPESIAAMSAPVEFKGN